MSIRFSCACGKEICVDQRLAGRKGNCKGCKAELIVPTPGRDSVRGRAATRVAAGATARTDEEAIPTVEVDVVEADEEEVVDLAVVEEEEDESQTYELDPATADLPPARPGGGEGPSFSATLGRISLDKRAECVAYGPQQRWALAGQDRDVRILNMKAGRKVGRFEDHEAPVTALAVSADGYALTGDADGTLLFWDAETGRRKKRLRGHDATVRAIAFAPNGRYAVSGGDDGTVRLWDLDEGREYHLAKSDWDEAVSVVAYSRDGKSVLAGGGKGRVQSWAVRTGERLVRVQADKSIASIAFSDDGGHITACAAPAMLNLMGSIPPVWRWDAETGKPVPCFRKRGSTDYQALFATLDAAGKRLIVAVVDPVEAKKKRLAELVDGRYPYSIEVWSLATGTRLHTFDKFEPRPVCMAVSPESTRLIVSGNDDTVQIFALPAF